jgi:hypothetical protein
MIPRGFGLPQSTTLTRFSFARNRPGGHRIFETALIFAHSGNVERKNTECFVFGGCRCKLLPSAWISAVQNHNHKWQWKPDVFEIAILPCPIEDQADIQAALAANWHKNQFRPGLFVQSPMALSAFLRRTQDFFHDRTEVSGLLLNLRHHLFRTLRRDSRLIPDHFRLPLRVFVFCVVHNMTNWIHNQTSIAWNENAN